MMRAYAGNRAPSFAVTEQFRKVEYALAQHAGDIKLGISYDYFVGSFMKVADMDKKKPEFSPFNTGLFHFCVQDPDIEALTNKIVEYGGKQRMPIRTYYPNEKPYKMVYVEDPFGVVFEIYTHSYELTYSSGAYQD